MPFINYEMEIQGQTTLLFPITPKFFPKINATWKRDGKEANAIDEIPVEGWFSENDQDVLNAKIAQLQSLVKNGFPLVFIFRKTTGEEIFRINRGHIQSFEEVESDGSRANHVQFKFSITEEKAVTLSRLVDFSRTDQTAREIQGDGSVRVTLRRVVSATGEFGNLVPARNFVLGLKPTAGNITREVIDDVSFDGVVTGTWDVDITKEEREKEGTTRILRWTERATTRPGLRNINWFRTQGAPFPIRGGQGQSSLSVTGTIRTFSLGDMPGIGDILFPFLNRISADSGPFVSDFSSERPRGVEFDADNPTQATVFELVYFFTLEFGEEPGDILPGSGFSPIGVGRPIGGSSAEEGGAEGGGASGIGQPSSPSTIFVGIGTPPQG